MTQKASPHVLTKLLNIGILKKCLGISQRKKNAIVLLGQGNAMNVLDGTRRKLNEHVAHCISFP